MKFSEIAITSKFHTNSRLMDVDAYVACLNIMLIHWNIVANILLIRCRHNYRKLYLTELTNYLPMLWMQIFSVNFWYIRLTLPSLTTKIYSYHTLRHLCWPLRSCENIVCSKIIRFSRYSCLCFLHRAEGGRRYTENKKKRIAGNRNIFSHLGQKPFEKIFELIPQGWGNIKSTNFLVFHKTRAYIFLPQFYQRCT